MNNKISWLDWTTSLFSCVADNNGRPRTFRQILFEDFATPHEWFYKRDRWINGNSVDKDTILKIRSNQIDKSAAKQTLMCFTPSAYYQCKKKGAEILVHTNPILQIDYDNLTDFDIDEVKQAIFDLPFVCCVSKSVSGNGLFAFILIEEPDKLKQYAEHCFHVFKYYGLNPDTTKGRNYSDLRFVSVDENILYRESPTPLKIQNFYKPPVIEKPVYACNSTDNLIKWAVREVQLVQPGNRSNIINRVCFTLGGHGAGLDQVVATINTSAQYQGEENYFSNIAAKSFSAGQLKPLAA